METDLKYSLMTTVAALAVIVIFSFVAALHLFKDVLESLVINMTKTKGGQSTAFLIYVR